MVDTNCKNCEKIFEQKKSSQMYCSSTCREKFHNDKRKIGNETYQDCMNTMHENKEKIGKTMIEREKDDLFDKFYNLELFQIRKSHVMELEQAEKAAKDTYNYCKQVFYSGLSGGTIAASILMHLNNFLEDWRDIQLNQNNGNKKIVDDQVKLLKGNLIEYLKLMLNDKSDELI
jgi:hypothetical protein